MSYLVMECRSGYAIVLDAQGRFLRAANLGYTVGEKLEEVILEQSVTPNATEQLQSSAVPTQTVSVRICGKRRKWMTRILAVAACLCLLTFGTERFFLFPYGTVRIQINPDVIVSMNRFQYVVGIEGLNDDGKALIEDYSYFGKRALVVSGELADRAKLLGYLAEGGEITLTVQGVDENWTVETEEVMVNGLQHHCSGSAHVKTSEDGGAIDDYHSKEEQGDKHHSEEEQGEEHHSGNEKENTHYNIEETEQEYYNTEIKEEEQKLQSDGGKYSNSFRKHRQKEHENKKSHE